MTVLAVFRSRSQTIDFVSRLTRYGVSVQTVNTPKEAGVGCGLSAKFSFPALLHAKKVLQTNRYSSFVGFYKTDYSFGRATFTPI